MCNIRSTHSGIVEGTRVVGHGAVYISTQMGTAVAQWLRHRAANRKVAGSIPDGVIGIYH